jgi:hypothetical protein
MDHPVKIDRLRAIRSGRPFPEKTYLDMMYVAHDLVAISKARPGPFKPAPAPRAAAVTAPAGPALRH